jgi:myo-inositol 2-dehydrogenase/D-chiro-inositol 1-dehydrogenase
VIGCGRVFRRFHLPAIARIPAISLRAGCDINPGRLQWIEQLPSRPTVFGTPAELFGAGLEAVLVLTPPASHTENVLQALEAGLHVLVEKPMALDPAEARQMARAAQSARRHLQVGFTRRFREPYRRLKKALEPMEPQRVRLVRFELAFPTSSWKAESDFLGQESLGGGVLDDVLSHQVDLVCWVLRGRPGRVRCEVIGSSGKVRSELEIGSISLQCESAHSRYTEWLEVELDDGTVLEASGSPMGNAGTSPEPWRRGRAQLRDRVGLLRDRLLRRPNVTLRSFEHQLRDFVGLIRGGQSDGATAEDGLQAAEIVAACRASIRQRGAWQDVGAGATPAG